MLKRLLALALWLLAASLATEAVLAFDADLRLEKPNRLIASETLLVQAEGAAIRHGIYRDIVLRAPGERWGFASRFELLGATLNGAPVPTRIERTLGRLRVYLGDPEHLLPPGRYTFRLRYALSPVVDEEGKLVWNVTGNGWTLPILAVRARLRWPKDVPLKEASAFIGPFLSQNQVPVEIEGHLLRVEAQRLVPGEGLTILARFPPGAFPASRAPSLDTVLALLLFFAELAYLLWGWERHGRDPKGPPLIPRFEPPEGVSAALARLVLKGQSDTKGFAAALLDLAARGFLIIQPGRAPTLIKRAKNDPSQLPPDLRALYAALPTRLSLEKRNAEQVQRAKSALEDALDLQKPRYLQDNAGFFFVAVLVVALYVATLAYRITGEFGAAVFAAVAVFFHAIFGAYALKVAALARERYLRIPGVGPVRELLRISLALLGVLIPPVLAFLLFWPFGGYLGAGALAGMLLLLAVFGYLLPAYTPEGIRLRQHLLGLARYLAITEEAELKRIHAPEDTPGRLARLLPYAVALDVEAPFGRRLVRVLKRADVEEATRSFFWYAPTGRDLHDPATLARLPSLAAAQLTQSVQAALAAGQGGGGGGGFSGGGVGGGGGGGW